MQTHRIVFEEFLVETHDGANEVAYVYSKNAAHWHHLAARQLALKPEAVGGQAYFISNGRDGVITCRELRKNIVGRRIKPVKVTFALTETVRGRLAFAPCRPPRYLFGSSRTHAPSPRPPRRTRSRAQIRRGIFLGNAIFDWATAGRVQHHILMCVKNAMPYTLWNGRFDCSRGAELLGYEPLYTMQQAYDDLAREIQGC